jgi:hypothetical protein
MLPPRELASTGIDLDAVPVPRIEERVLLDLPHHSV